MRQSTQDDPTKAAKQPQQGHQKRKTQRCVPIFGYPQCPVTIQQLMETELSPQSIDFHHRTHPQPPRNTPPHLQHARKHLSKGRSSEQDPARTTDLSTSVCERVANEEACSEAAEGASDDESLSIGVTIPSPSVAEWLLGIAGIRKWAHTVEFFAFGVPVAAALLLWWGRPELTGARMLVSFAISACASLFDQTHKLFVPGREFDASDLVFDVLVMALGLSLCLVSLESFVAI